MESLYECMVKPDFITQYFLHYTNQTAHFDDHSVCWSGLSQKCNGTRVIHINKTCSRKLLDQFYVQTIVGIIIEHITKKVINPNCYKVLCKYRKPPLITLNFVSKETDFFL